MHVARRVSFGRVLLNESAHTNAASRQCLSFIRSRGFAGSPIKSGGNATHSAGKNKVVKPVASWTSTRLLIVPVIGLAGFGGYQACIANWDLLVNVFGQLTGTREPHGATLPQNAPLSETFSKPAEQTAAADETRPEQDTSKQIESKQIEGESENLGRLVELLEAKFSVSRSPSSSVEILDIEDKGYKDTVGEVEDAVDAGNITESNTGTAGELPERVDHGPVYQNARERAFTAALTIVIQELQSDEAKLRSELLSECETGQHDAETAEKQVQESADVFEHEAQRRLHNLDVAAAERQKERHQSTIEEERFRQQTEMAALEERLAQENHHGRIKRLVDLRIMQNRLATLRQVEEEDVLYLRQAQKVAALTEAFFCLAEQLKTDQPTEIELANVRRELDRQQSAGPPQLALQFSQLAYWLR